MSTVANGVRRVWWLAAISTAGICLLVVAGGVVRLTGSGLGCDDWPNCNDTRFVDVSSGHTAIEQVNRLLSGIVGIPTLVLVIAAVRLRPRMRGVLLSSVGLLVTVVANGVVGGVAVRQDLHPVLIQSHFLLAMISIAFGVDVMRRTASTRGRSPDGRTPRVGAGLESARRLTYLLALGTAVALVTGTVVTGTGPHAGDEDAQRFGFDISDVARIHSVGVIVTVGIAVLLAAAVGRAAHDADVGGVRSTLSTWIFLALIQGGIGYAQYFNGVPELLVGAHIAGATALWVTTVWLAITVHDLDRRPAITEAGARVRFGSEQTAVS